MNLVRFQIDKKRLKVEFKKEKRCEGIVNPGDDFQFDRSLLNDFLE